MRTTLNINDALLRELRELARQRKRSMREVIEETLRIGLSATESPNKAVRIKPFDVGIKPAYRGMSMNQLYDQLEGEESLKVAEE